MFPLFIVVLLSGCTKEFSEPVNELVYSEKQFHSNGKSGNFGFIGNTHNQLLEDYLKSGRYESDSSLSFVLNDFYDFQLIKYPSASNYSVLYQQSISKIENARSITEYFSGMQTTLDILNTNGKISSNDHATLSIILNDTLPFVPPVSFENPDMTRAFSSVYNASSYFWIQGYGATYNNAKFLDRTEKTIIADAIGGSLWFWTGFAAPLIAGAYSLGVYHA